MIIETIRQPLSLQEHEYVKEFFVEFFSEFYKKEIGKILLNKERRLLIDFSLIEKFDFKVADLLLQKPEEVINLAEEVLYELEPEAKGIVRIRFYNFPKIYEKKIRELRSENLGKLVIVDGIIKRASEIRPEVYETIFECIDCKSKYFIVQTERSIKKPVKCVRCNSKNFELIGEKVYDARWIVIEEPYELISGERPSTILVYLKEDLVEPKLQSKTDPGNRIKVIGILKTIPRKLRKSKSREMEIFIDANYFESLETEWEEIELSKEDVEKILEEAKKENFYTTLVESIAPTIYGNREIKEALLLQMVGGNEEILPDGNRIRGEIHILLVGDPGTGKSQLLKIISSLAPRAKYVSGKYSSAAGLIATVTRDEEFLGGWVLEAGLVVMANKSVAAIDEFEKVDKKDLVALMECMEQGTVSIAKANIVATLPAKTAILAAANPKYGRFDPYIPIKEQIEIPEVLLSRFDLKFVLKDIPNIEEDEKIIEHIKKTRYFVKEELKNLYDKNFIKKFVAYARKLRPKLTEEAFNVIADFYKKLREKSKENAPVSITLRQFEGLIRLATASAKIRLSDKVEKIDAERAINLMIFSLKQFGFDPTLGTIDIDLAEGRMSATQRGKIRIVRQIIDELEKVFGNMIPEEEIINRAKQAGVDNAEEILNKMKLAGELITHKPGFVGKI